MNENDEDPLKVGKLDETVGITVPTNLVRRIFRPRPWPVPPLSAARTAPEPGAYGRMTDVGSP